MGAPYEGGVLERLVWRAIGTTADGRTRYTDDTQMSMDLAESLSANRRLDQDDLASRFAASYHWSRGYGPAAAKLLKRIAKGASWKEANRSIYADGSLGNGGAMRAPVVGLFYSRKPDALVKAARASAEVTHSHPLGMEGAVLIATATGLALVGAKPVDILDETAGRASLEPFISRLAVARSWLKDEAEAQDPAEIRERLGNRITAAESVVTALYLALRYLNRRFEEMQAESVRLGGDTDTIGAMAGAIWGAANGSGRLPQGALDRLENRERLTSLATTLRAASLSR